MGIGWDDVAGGAATGGLYNVAKAAGLFDGSTTSQVPLLTPEQQAAQGMLLKFAKTGKFGDFQAGAAIPLGYGDYNTTGIEQQGLSSLQSLLRDGIPDQFRLGDQALHDLLATGPEATDAMFNPFKAQVQRQVGQSNAALKRGAGFAGNLYSTSTIKGLGDIQARGNETLTSQLANLTNQALDRKLSAAGLAYQAGTAEQNAKLSQIGASQEYGDLTRSLNDQAIKARDAELLRRRSELTMPIQAAESLSGANAQWGVPSVTTSPYQQLLSMVGQVGGTAAGAYLGGPAGAAVGNRVGTALTTPPQPQYTPGQGMPLWR